MIKNNLDINNRTQLNKLGYDSKNYYCGNYSMQKYYSYIYNKMRKLGVKFALNRACFIHDIGYGQLYSKVSNEKSPKTKLKKIIFYIKKILKVLINKIRIDNKFYIDMQQCIIYEYKNNNIGFLHALYLRIIAMLFYGIVLSITPIYLGIIIKNGNKNTKNKKGTKKV